MRLLLISYGFMMQRGYQWKGIELARLCDRLVVLVPRRWKELWSGGCIQPEDGPLDSLEHHRLRLLFNKNRHFALLPPRRFRRILRDVRPDVIDFDNEPFNLAAAQVVATVRRYSPNTRVYLHAAQNLMKRYPPPFNWLERYVFRNCAGVFARNDAAADVLLKRGLSGRKIHVMGHGVSLREFAGARRLQEQSEPMPGSVLYIGALAHQKGVDTLLRACALCREFHRLTLAGEGPERTALEKLSAELGISSRVTFAGRVPHAVLLDMYARHACLVLPSRTTATLVEQFGRVLLEAMAAGCPVVASSSGNIPRVVGTAGLIFPEDDVNELARILTRVLSDSSLRGELRKSGVHRVRERYEWSVVAREMMDIFSGGAA